MQYAKQRDGPGRGTPRAYVSDHLLSVDPCGLLEEGGSDRVTMSLSRPALAARRVNWDIV